MSILPDVLAPDLKLIFCGTAASAISARDGAYYANPTNYFWRTLHEIGLTPQRLQPVQFRELLDYRIGLTDLAKHAQGNDSDLKSDDFDVAAFLEKMHTYRPQSIAFTSKKAASLALNCRTRDLRYGLQDSMIAEAKIWVLTSPSGAARSYWDITVWQALADSW